MIRVGISPLVLLINNSGYVIEEEIHSGPYNKISDWNYTAVVEGMAGTCKNLFTAKAPVFLLSSSLLRSSPQALLTPPNHPPPACFVLFFSLFWVCRLCCPSSCAAAAAAAVLHWQYYGLPLQDMHGLPH